MAYCPRCGREQRCGCEKCHICGVEVVERRVQPTEPWMRAEARAAGKAARRLPHEARAGVSPAVSVDSGLPRGGRRVPIALPAAMLAFGCGIILVTLIGAINSALNFPSAGGAASLAEAFKRLGYYLGNLLYESSVRAIIGFALVSLGLLLEPGWPFADSEHARRVTRAVGLVMLAVASLCFLAAVILVLPGGSTSLLLKNLLPSKWAAVTTVLVTGAALLSGGCLLMARSFGPDSGAAGGTRASESARPGAGGGEGLVNIGSNADESSRGSGGNSD